MCLEYSVRFADIPLMHICQGQAPVPAPILRSHCWIVILLNCDHWVRTNQPWAPRHIQLKTGDLLLQHDLVQGCLVVSEEHNVPCAPGGTLEERNQLGMPNFLEEWQAHILNHFSVAVILRKAARCMGPDVLPAELRSASHVQAFAGDQVNGCKLDDLAAFFPCFTCSASQTNKRLTFGIT